eukprot:TRINITY_DN13910_c0_g1_i2.p1 TRINITY_DN13910_c0_g1~~TRINITY_DN13910_c0_g1_i2.p1  ORF type:complete len:262 (-),score=75.92 TRINITY_DN13910_c0_g1_i2:244-999(-)
MAAHKHDCVCRLCAATREKAKWKTLSEKVCEGLAATPPKKPKTASKTKTIVSGGCGKEKMHGDGSAVGVVGGDKIEEKHASGSAVGGSSADKANGKQIVGSVDVGCGVKQVGEQDGLVVGVGSTTNKDGDKCGDTELGSAKDVGCGVKQVGEQDGLVVGVGRSTNKDGDQCGDTELGSAKDGQESEKQGREPIAAKSGDGKQDNEQDGDRSVVGAEVEDKNVKQENVLVPAPCNEGGATSSEGRLDKDGDG